MSWIVLQIDRNAKVPHLCGGRLGSIHPVNSDGFYRDRGDAEFMAEQRPDLTTMVAEVHDR